MNKQQIIEHVTALMSSTPERWVITEDDDFHLVIHHPFSGISVCREYFGGHWYTIRTSESSDLYVCKALPTGLLSLTAWRFRRAFKRVLRVDAAARKEARDAAWAVREAESVRVLTRALETKLTSETRPIE